MAMIFGSSTQARQSKKNAGLTISQVQPLQSSALPRCSGTGRSVGDAKGEARVKQE
jgi:hypothetical protein